MYIDLWMRKLRLGKIKFLAQGHKVEKGRGRGQTQVSKLGCKSYASKPTCWHRSPIACWELISKRRRVN